jgi:signal transduction histidine kinase
MTLFGALGLIIGITNIALSILVYFQDRKNKLNRVWALFTLSVSTWGFGAYAVTITLDPQTALLLWRLIVAGVIFIPITFLAFTYIFLNKKETFLIKVVGILGLVLLAVDTTPYFLTSVQFVFDSFYWNNPSVPYNFFVAFFVITISYTLIVAYRNALFERDLIRKKQIFFFALASTIGFLGGTTSYLPAYGVYLYPYFNASIVVFTIIITYTIIKHRLFNIKVIAVQVVTVGLLVFILIRLIFAQNIREFVTESALFSISLILGIFLIHAVFQEIKQREKIEKLVGKLNDLNLTLHQKVAEQTVEIRTAYEAEKKARMELEKLNDAKDQFIMITQHHLRTPVTSLAWGLDEILKGSYGTIVAETREAIQDMKSSTTRLIRLVDDFLNITAIKVGTSILNLTTDSLKPSLEDILDELRGDIAKMKLTIVFPTDDIHWPELKLDHSKVRESLFVVVENAVRYNREGGTVMISTKTDKEIFELSIENTGIGMTSEEGSKIGSALFYRGEYARKAYPIGMGIGLSVVKAIIRAHHGTFTIESAGHGQGARVTVKFPLK